MQTGKPLIFDLDFNELAGLVDALNEPSYRTEQIWKGLYKSFWDSPDQFTTLPERMRVSLNDHFSFSRLTPTAWLESTDGETTKTLFAIDEHNSIETVLMRYHDRRTLCVSSQAGCAMGCSFCATGQMGFRKNLSSGEIVEQVIYYARQLARDAQNLTNVVIMGMGEPFHNYDHTMAAVDRLNHPLGFGFGARRFTISTVGVVPAMERFIEENRQVNLAVSLHAADDALRSSLLPINKKYPLDLLMRTCLKYVQKTNRRITFEWALIQGVNDDNDQAEKLTRLLSPFIINHSAMCHVNLIPLNPTRRYNGKAATKARAFLFKNTLERGGIPCTVRVRRGIDIQAGCGQLATQ